MCYGSGCPYEIWGGEHAGECGKRRGEVCPDTIEEEIEDDDENN